jgi:hypothetical protein
MFDANGSKKCGMEKQKIFIISHGRPLFQTLFASLYPVLNAKP